MTPERAGGHCDLCHADLEIGQLIYVHGTPSTGTLEQAQADKGVQWFEDPHWAACEGCHRRVLALDEGRWTPEEWVVMMTKRSLRHQTILGTTLPSTMEQAMRQAQLEHVIKVLSSFARCHVPEFYSEVNEGVDY